MTGTIAKRIPSGGLPITESSAKRITAAVTDTGYNTRPFIATGAYNPWGVSWFRLSGANDRWNGSWSAGPDPEANNSKRVTETPAATVS